MAYQTFSENKQEKPTSKIVEDYLVAGYRVSLDFLSNKGHDVRNLSIIISRLKKKYPYIETETTIGKSNKQISVYYMPM